MRNSARTPRRIDIAGIRRAQIVEAAVAVIAEQGVQNLSLSEIENKVGMSRGQLTYYFKTKEAIYLAVFDRLLARMNQERGRTDDQGDPAGWMPGWDAMINNILEGILDKPSPEFRCLHFTFLAQIGHRADFRRRLASLYEQWRAHMTQQFRKDCRRRPATRKVSARALATLVQAFIHGIAIQSAVDPEAIDFHEVAELCLDLVSNYLWPLTARNGKSSTANSKRARRRARRPSPNGVKP